MTVTKFELKITNFDNQAMADEPSCEVACLLRQTADRIESGLLGDGYEGGYLMDSNGNRVGEVSVFTEDDDTELVCRDCGETVEPEADRRGIGSHCPECDATL